MGKTGSGRRRYIAREDSADAVSNEPATFHPPPTGKIFTTGCSSAKHDVESGTRPLPHAHTIDLPGGSMSRYSTRSHDPTHSTGFARSYTTDVSPVGYVPSYTDSRLAELDLRHGQSSQYARRDSASSDTSYRSAVSDISSARGFDPQRPRFGSKERGPYQAATYAEGSYPATYPGPRPWWESDRLSEISESSSISKERYSKPLVKKPTGAESVVLRRPIKAKTQGSEVSHISANKSGITQSTHSSVNKGALDTSDSIADLVICSPKQARPWSGRFKPEDVEKGKEISATYNGLSSVTEPPWKAGQKDDSFKPKVELSTVSAKRPNIFSPVAGPSVKSPGIFSPVAVTSVKSPRIFSPGAVTSVKSPRIFSPVAVTSARSPGIFSPVALTSARSPGIFSPVAVTSVKSPRIFSPGAVTSVKSPGIFSPVAVTRAERPGIFSPVAVGAPVGDVIEKSSDIPQSSVAQTAQRAAVGPAVGKFEPLAVATPDTAMATPEMQGIGLTREERIALYKERRRKELAALFGGSAEQSSSFELSLKDEDVPSYPEYSQPTEILKEEKPETVCQISAFSPKPISPLFPPGVHVEPKPIIPDTNVSAQTGPRLSPSGAMSNLLASSQPSAFTKVTPSSPKSNLLATYVPQETPKKQDPVFSSESLSLSVSTTDAIPSVITYPRLTVLSPVVAITTASPSVLSPVTVTSQVPMTLPQTAVASKVAVTSSHVPLTSSQFSVTSSHTTVTSSAISQVTPSIVSPVSSTMLSPSYPSISQTTSIPQSTDILDDQTQSRRSRLVAQKRVDNNGAIEIDESVPCDTNQDQNKIDDFHRMPKGKSGSLPLNFGLPQDLKKWGKNISSEGTKGLFGDIQLHITEDTTSPKHRLKRMDSFNRPDSPIRELMSLPKDSVIARNRRQRTDSSSSTDSAGSPKRSPRVSPRIIRKEKLKKGSSESSSLSVDYGLHPGSGRKDQRYAKEESKPAEQLSSHYGDVSAISSRYSRSPSQSSAQSHVKSGFSGLSPIGQKKLISPSLSPRMGQHNSHSHSPKSPPVEQWATPPSTPQNEARTRLMSPPTGIVSPVGSYSLDKQSSTEIAPGSIPRPGSGSIVSDSSTASSRRERRRFRKREKDGTPDRSPNIDSLKVRPGKKDKSSVRKSALNTAEEQEELNKAGEESDDLDDFYSFRQRQRVHQVSAGDAIAGRTAIHHPAAFGCLSPVGTKQSVQPTVLKVQESPPPVEKFAHVRSAKPVHNDSKGLRPVALESKSAGAAPATQPNATPLVTGLPPRQPVFGTTLLGKQSTPVQSPTPLKTIEAAALSAFSAARSPIRSPQQPASPVAIATTVGQPYSTTASSSSHASVKTSTTTVPSSWQSATISSTIKDTEKAKTESAAKSFSDSKPVIQNSSGAKVVHSTAQSTVPATSSTASQVKTVPSSHQSIPGLKPLASGTAKPAIPETVQRKAEAVGSAVRQLVETAITPEVVRPVENKPAGLPHSQVVQTGASAGSVGTSQGLNAQTAVQRSPKSPTSPQPQKAVIHTGLPVTSQTTARLTTALPQSTPQPQAKITQIPQARSAAQSPTKVLATAQLQAKPLTTQSTPVQQATTQPGKVSTSQPLSPKLPKHLQSALVTSQPQVKQPIQSQSKIVTSQAQATLTTQPQIKATSPQIQPKLITQTKVGVPQAQVKLTTQTSPKLTTTTTTTTQKTKLLTHPATTQAQLASVSLSQDKITTQPQAKLTTTTTTPQAKLVTQTQPQTTLAQAQVTTLPQHKPTTQPQAKVPTTLTTYRLVTQTTTPTTQTSTALQQAKVATQPQPRLTTATPQTKLVTQPQTKLVTTQPQVKLVSTPTSITTVQPQTKVTTQPQVKLITTPQPRLMSSQPQANVTTLQPQGKVTTPQQQTKSATLPAALTQSQGKPKTQYQVRIPTSPQVTHKVGQQQHKQILTSSGAVTPTSIAHAKVATPKTSAQTVTTQATPKVVSAPVQAQTVTTQATPKLVSAQVQPKVVSAQVQAQTITTQATPKVVSAHTQAQTVTTQATPKVVSTYPQANVTASHTQPQASHTQQQQVRVATSQVQPKVALTQQQKITTATQQQTKVPSNQPLALGVSTSLPQVQSVSPRLQTKFATTQNKQVTTAAIQSPAAQTVAAVPTRTAVVQQQPVTAASLQATKVQAVPQQQQQLPNLVKTTPVTTTQQQPKVGLQQQQQAAAAKIVQSPISKAPVQSTLQQTVAKQTTPITAVQQTVTKQQQPLAAAMRQQTPAAVAGQVQPQVKQVAKAPILTSQAHVTKTQQVTTTTTITQAGVQQTAAAKPQVMVTTQQLPKTLPEKVTVQEKIITTPIQSPPVDSAISRLSQNHIPGGKGDVRQLPQKGTGDITQVTQKPPGPEPKYEENHTSEQSILRKPEIPSVLRDKAQDYLEIKEDSVARKRRTPERTQSLREEKPLVNTTETNNVPKRAQSFRAGDVVKRRFKPDNPEEELAKILNRRSRNLEEWESQAQEAENDVTEAEKAIEEYERQLEEDKLKRNERKEVVVDTELSHVLRARRSTMKEDINANTETVSGEIYPPQQSITQTTLVQNSVEQSKPYNKVEPNSGAYLLSEPKSHSILKKTGSFEDSQRNKAVISDYKKDSFVGESNQNIPKSPLNKEGSFESIIQVPYVNHQTVQNQSPIRTSQQISLSRTESFETGVSPSSRTERAKKTFQKAHTIDAGVMDRELASALRQRRATEGDEEEEDEAPRRQRSLTPEGDEEDGGVRLSVFERIVQVETKMEVERSCAGSGFITPASLLRIRSSQGSSGASPRGGTASPRPGYGQPIREAPDVLMSDSQLLAKLSDVALVQDAAALRRKRFQTRNRDDWRTRTQPITEEEVHEADALGSVAAFRAAIMRNTGINLFKQTPKVSTAVRKIPGQEIFPQPYRREKLRERRRSGRYKTQPITSQELCEIPESEPITPLSPVGEVRSPLSWKKQMRKNVEQKLAAAAGDDSDSDFEKLVEVNYKQFAKPKKLDDMQEFTMSMDVPEDDRSKMSLSQKMALFRKMEQEEKLAASTPLTPKTARKLSDRKKRLERSRTQPVTEDEVSLASEFAKTCQSQEEPSRSISSENIREPEVVNRGKSEERDLAQGDTASEDELSKLSLAEKMKLFSKKKKVPTATLR